MRAPTIQATIDRRILVNYRVDPDALAAVLPDRFRPALVGGYGIGGICHGVALSTDGWAIAPLELDDLRSSFFDDTNRFPPGTAVADSAFLMAGLPTTWRPQPELCATQ